MNNVTRIAITLGVIAIISLCATTPVYADALETAAQKFTESKDKVKTIVTAIIAIASIIGVGGVVWALLVQRSTAAIVTGAVGLGVAGIALAVLASL